MHGHKLESMDRGGSDEGWMAALPPEVSSLVLCVDFISLIQPASRSSQQHVGKLAPVINEQDRLMMQYIGVYDFLGAFEL